MWRDATSGVATWQGDHFSMWNGHVAVKRAPMSPVRGVTCRTFWDRCRTAGDYRVAHRASPFPMSCERVPCISLHAGGVS